MRISFKKMISHLMLAMVMLLLPLSTAYAKAGCCSKHGGVASCDSASGFLRCKDGTLSKSCKCDGTTATTTTKEKAPAHKKKEKKAKEAANTAVTAAPAAASTAKSTKGCCAKHGGVGSCNKKTGYYMCKDGTQSTTCKC